MARAVFTYKKFTITHPVGQYKIFDKQGHEIKANHAICDLASARKLIDDCIAFSHAQPKVLTLQVWP